MMFMCLQRHPPPFVITRPKAGSPDVYVPPPSPSRERELQACLDTAARYNSRLDRGETYRPESE